ncbi:hypothetical protein ACFLRM_04490 [Acidobacteriota bacterium]
MLIRHKIREFSRSPAAPWVYCGAIVAFIDSAFQVCSIRIICYYFPLAMMLAISLVASLSIFITGLGALLSRRLNSFFNRFAIVAGIAMFSSCLILGLVNRYPSQIFPFDNLFLAVITIIFLVLFFLAPFILLGVLIGSLYQKTMEEDPKQIRLLIAVFALFFFFGYITVALIVLKAGLWNMILITSTLALFLPLRPSRFLAAITLSIAVIFIFNPGLRLFAETQKIPWLFKTTSQQQAVLGFWSPYARLDFIDQGEGRIAGLYDGFQYWLTGPMSNDEKLRKKMYESLQGDILAIGSGGGIGLLSLQDTSRITAVELDPGVVSAFKGPLSQFNQNIYNRVHLAWAGDGRAFLESTDKQYDIIIFEGAEIALSRSIRSIVNLDFYLYTKESIQTALNRLKSEGLLIIIHTGGAVPVSRVINGFPENVHWRAFESDITLIENPLTFGFGKNRKIIDPMNLTFITTAVSFSRDSVDRFAGVLLNADVEVTELSYQKTFLRHISGSTSITDNKPLLHFTSWKLAIPLIVPAALLIIFLSVVVLFRKRRRLSIYFVMIGTGYITVELYVVNGMRSFLGGYVETAAVALGAIAVSTATGALASSVINRKRLVLVLIPAFIILPILLTHLPWTAPLALKVLIIILGVFPAGFAMGIFFPKGLAQAERGAAGTYYAIDTLGTALGFLLFYISLLAGGFFGVFIFFSCIYLLTTTILGRF